VRWIGRQKKVGFEEQLVGVSKEALNDLGEKAEGD
jgi:hypothetical protein